MDVSDRHGHARFGLMCAHTAVQTFQMVARMVHDARFRRDARRDCTRAKLYGCLGHVAEL